MPARLKPMPPFPSAELHVHDLGAFGG